MSSNPLGRFERSCTTPIVLQLESDAQLWLASGTLGSIRISSDFYVSDDTLLFDGSSQTYSQIVIDSLRVVFAHVKLAAQLHTEDFSEDYHLKWILDKSELSLLETSEPHTTFHNALLNMGGHSVQALLRLMRIPTRFEGGTDFMFERYIQVALTLLFEPEDILSIQSMCGGTFKSPILTLTNPHLPLIISGESFEWDNAAQECFAMYAQPTLMEIVRLSAQRDILPEHCIVYGIHCAGDKMRIIAHFPLQVKGEDEGCWEFAQIMVAEHWIGLMELPHIQELLIMHVDDNAIVNRWRVGVALFTIRDHVRRLKGTLKVIKSGTPHPTIDGSSHKNQSPPLTSPTISCRPRTGVSKQLRLYWRSPKISVPASWIPPEQVEIQLPKRDDESWLDNVERHIPAMLLRLVLHPLRHSLTPMNDQEIWDNHLSHDYQGPDFVHWVHVPRSRAKWVPPTESNLTTEPHLNRCYDLMTMATRTWDEINVFIANVFANFADYSVLWRPVAKYTKEVKVKDEKRIVEIETIDYRHGNLVMDFALSIRTVAASTSFTIKRAPLLPLTSCSPAALVGLRTIDMAGNGSHISEDELQVIGNLMTAHSRPIRSALEVAGNQEENVPEWATVMGTFLKRGFVHLIACKPVLEGKVEVEIIDSLPVKTKVEELEELEDRMRLVIALFTLQRHVVRFASHWCDIALPGDLMDDEHEAIVEVTGLSTPPVSDDEE